jgi:hypothetical protein
LGGQTEKLHNADWQVRQTKRLGWHTKRSRVGGAGMQARQSGGKAHGKRNKAGRQAGKEIRKQRHARKGWQERQGRADNHGGWVGEPNGQQAVRQGSREADKLARKGRR